jgi:hypothetical protein
MSQVCKIESGEYTLTIEDATGQSEDLGLVRATPLRFQWGDLRRTSNTGILPVEVTTVVDDPRDKLKGLLQGGIIETNYEVSVVGPRGPTGERFKLELWPKERTRSDPLSKRTYPDKTRLTFYDGMKRAERPSSANVDSFPNNLSVLKVFREFFGVANDGLYGWASLGCEHSTIGSSNFITDTELDNLVYPFRSSESFRTWWEVMVDLCERYQLQAFQDPFDHGPNQLPRWKVIPQRRVGTDHTGMTTDTEAFLGNMSNETLTKDSVTANPRNLAQERGEEYESAVIFSISEQLIDEESNPEERALVVNGKELLRDGTFYYEKVSDNEPLYGSTTYGTVARPQVSLDPQKTSATYFTERIRFGSGEHFVELTYDFEQTSGDTSVSGFECALQHIGEDGSIISETIGGKGADKTIQLTVSGPGRVRVAVTVPYDSGSDIVAGWGDASLKAWASEFKRAQDASQKVTSFVHEGSQEGTLTQEVEKVDMIVLSLEDLVARSNKTDDQAPVGTYDMNFPTAVAFTAGDLTALIQEKQRPAGTQTLRSTIDQVIGPGTRILVENLQGDVQRRLVPSGGRTVHTKDRYTELADIEMPTFS